MIHYFLTNTVPTHNSDTPNSEIYQNSVVFWVDINCISADMRPKDASLRSIVPSIPKLYGIVPTAREKVPIVDGVMLERVDRATMAVHHRF